METLPQKNNEKNELDWSRIEGTKREMREIFDSIERQLDSVKVMTEIAVERGFVISPETQKKSDEILKKFEPYGEYMPILYKMISDLGSINTMAFQEGLLVTAPEYTKKKEEIKNRK